MASISYRPEQYEQAYYLELFKAADVNGTYNIGGADAVKFFARSKLPVAALKNIWTVADQPSTSSLDLKKFAVAVRLIQLTQNGQKGKGQNLETPPGVVLKPAFFEGVSGVTVQMPPPQQQGGMPPPQPTPQQPNRAMPPPPGSQPSSPQASPRRMQAPPPQQQQQQVPPSPSRALVGMDPYTLSPQERQRYENLFPSYAKPGEDGVSQFVYGAEAVPLFMKSGVDPNKLREIWNMVDRDPVDNRLDKLEFALAMHLIVCVSKKNLPMPPGGTLPNSLKALKAASKQGSSSGDAAAAAAAGAVPPQQQMQMPPPQAEAAMPPPATGMGMGSGGPPPLGGPGSGAMGGMSISDAFEGMSTSDTYSPPVPAPAPEPEIPAAAPEPALPSYVPDVQAAPTPAMVAEPPTPQPQPTYVQQPQSPQPAVTTPPLPPAPAPMAAASVGTYEASDSQAEELTKLKSVLQKLQAENISLKAQLGNMTEEEKHVQQELGQTVSEITALTSDLGAQRQKVLDAKNRLLEAKAELKAQSDTKSVLTELISEAKETEQAIEGATETIRASAEAQNSAPQVEEAEDLFDMGYSNPVSAPLPAAEHPPEPQQGIEGFGNEGFANEMSISSNITGMGGGAASLPQPPPQPAGDIVPLRNTPEEPQQPPVPEPAGQGYQQQPMYPSYGAPAPAPPPASYPTPTNIQRPAAEMGQTPGHVRNASGFDAGYLMGGSGQALPQENSRDNDNVSQAAHSFASTGDYGYDDQAFEIVENMKKKAKKADDLARDAEAAYRKLAAETDELRTDADRAEAKARSLAAAPDEKKKGRFGGGKKKVKKAKEEADQAAKDAAAIKKHFMEIQGRALEAQTVATQTRTEADRLRDEAEAAELDMAAAASKKQRQPAPAPPPAPAAPPAANGYGGVPPQPGYGGMGAAPHQAQPPQYGMSNGAMMPAANGGGYNNYTNGMGGDYYGQQQQKAYGAPPQMSLPDPSMSAPGVMGNGGGDYGMPSPGEFQQTAPPATDYQQMQMAPPAAAYQQMAPPAAGGDPYASPF